MRQTITPTDLDGRLLELFDLPEAERKGVAIKHDLFLRLTYQPVRLHAAALHDIALTQGMSLEDCRAEFEEFAKKTEAKQKENARTPGPIARVAGKPEKLEQELIAPLQTETLLDLVSRKIAPTRFIVKAILAEGLGILAGPPKYGKSLLVMALTLAVGNGSRFIGEFDCEPGRVLYCALEDSDNRLQERFKTMLAGQVGGKKEKLAMIEIATSIHKTTEGGLEQIEQWLGAHDDARLVIVDTLARVRRAPGRNGNSYLDDTDFMAPLQALALAHHVCILVVHHTRKMQAADPLDRISGTTGLVGVADQAWILKRESRGQADAVLEVTGRDIESAEIAMTMNERMQWLYKGDAHALQKTSERQAIVNFLDENAGVIYSSRQIAEAVGKKQSAVCNLLSKLHAEGIVLSGGFGKHYIPKERI